MTKWFYHGNGKQHGPLEDAEIAKLARDGTLKPSDKVWNAGMGKDWAEASTIAALFPAGSDQGQKKGLRLKKEEEPKPKSPDAPAAASQAVVMQHLNAARASEQARARKNSPARLALKFLLPAAVICGALFSAKHFFKERPLNAKVESVVAAGGIHLQQAPVIWVSMIFTEIPQTGDPSDVRIVLKSPCLKSDMTFNWPQIAANPVVRPRKDSTKKTPAEGISPDKQPRLNYQFDTPLRIPVESLQEKLDLNTNLKLTAELYWAGQKMHSKSCSVRNWYVVE